MIDITKIYTSNNCGKFRVIKYIDWKRITIEFIDTGYVVETYSSSITSGCVKDKLAPNVYGVGFIGEGSHKGSIKGKDTDSYGIWYKMLTRCYSSNHHKKNPTYKDCTVCDEWLNFQVFAEWFDNNYIKGYQLDKDIKIKGNKVYSPSTCLFVTSEDNNIEAQAKSYKFISPSGGYGVGFIGEGACLNIKGGRCALSNHVLMNAHQ